MSIRKTYKIVPLDLLAYQQIGRLRAGRLLAIFILSGLLFLPLLLIFLPWQQNISGTGHLAALNPLDRTRTIPAPVNGRIVKLHVQEGDIIKKGDVLLEMEDLDKDYALRLGQQLSFVRKELEAAHSTLESLDDQLIQLQEEREFSIKAASSQLQVAVEKVRAERATLMGLKATLVQKEQDYRRKERLLKGGAMSVHDFQKAEGEYKLAKSKVKASEAKVDEARNQEFAKASDIQKIGAEKMAKIDKLRAERKKSEQNLQKVRKSVTEAETTVQRQSTQRIVAPRDGSILRINGVGSDVISRGQSLIQIVPETSAFVLEFWVRGIDAPLVTQGRKARVQFEGWPAIQVGGWPSVAMGTFGGIIYRTDTQARADGYVRVLVTPDPEDDPWPEQPFLRQGVRASGQVQLNTVSVGYEIWRQLNAFPISNNNIVESSSESKSSATKKSDSSSKKNSKK